MTDHHANSLGGRFAVRLLGGLQLFDPTGRRLRIGSRKARALLAYRRALSDLRSVIGDELEANSEALWLRPESFATDVERVVRATALPKAELVGDAATKYTGDFLEGFSVDSEPFARWQLLERQCLRSRMLACRPFEHALQARTPATGPVLAEYGHAS